MKKKWQWVCRDDDGWWVICPLQSIRPVKAEGAWAQRDRNGIYRQVAFNPGRYASAFGHFELKLKPGEGPKRVEFTAKFVD